MIRDPDLIHYACIAKGTTVLAEFSWKSAAALGAIAARCLDRTPPFHSFFTHTVRWRTYTYLIEEPFVYFAISNDQLDKSDVLAFLNSVRDAFVDGFNGDEEMEKLSSYCFQADVNPIFRQLLSTDPGLYHVDGNGFGSPMCHRKCHDRILEYGSGSVRERMKPNWDQDFNKTKNESFPEEHKISRRNGEKENDENVGNGIESSHEFPLLTHKNGGLYSAESTGRQKAKKVWKKQVWVVVWIDLIICVILFVLWLCLCSGLKCIDK